MQAISDIFLKNFIHFLVHCDCNSPDSLINGIIEFFMIGVSVGLSDRSLHRDEEKNFVKKCPQWGWKPGPPDLQENSLPTELGRNLLGRRFLK